MTILKKLKSLFRVAPAFPGARTGDTAFPAKDAITRAEWYARIAFPPETCREIESQARMEGPLCGTRELASESARTRFPPVKALRNCISGTKKVG